MSAIDNKRYVMGKGFQKYGYPIPDVPIPGNEERYLPKVDCFAFDEERGCKVLTYTWCRYEKCKFFKTEEQYQNGLIDSIGCY